MGRPLPLLPLVARIHGQKNESFVGKIRSVIWVATHSTGTVSDAIARNFTLFSLEVRQSLREIAMLSRAAGIPGHIKKPPGGFV